MKYDYELFCGAVGARDGFICRVEVILRNRGSVLPATLLTCDGGLDGHHLVPKQRIRSAWNTAAAVASGKLTGREVPPLLLGTPLSRLLEDERNGILACRRHHDLLERTVVRLHRDDLPDGCTEFAESIGLLARLEADFPRAAGWPNPTPRLVPRELPGLSWLHRPGGWRG